MEASMKNLIKHFWFTALLAAMTFASLSCDDIFVTEKQDTWSVTGVTITNKPYSGGYSLLIGGTVVFSAKVVPDYATNKAVTWTSSDSNIAAVDNNGKVTAVAPGTVDITVTTKDKGFSDRCTVSVLDTVPVTGVKLGTSFYLLTGNTITPYFTIEPSNATNRNVTWTSSDPGVVSVTIGGNIYKVANGTAVITVTTVDGGFSDSCTVKVSPPLRNSLPILVTQQPDKTEYLVGEELDITGLEVTAFYSDGTMESLPIDFVRISNFDSTGLGAKELIITYNYYCQTKFTVWVVPRDVSRIGITAPPDKLEYFEGEELDITGLEITAFYNDGTSEIIENTAVRISGFDSETAGIQTLTITYAGKTANFNVTVIGKEIAKIEVTAPPDKLEYFVREELDITGLEVTAFYNDGTSEPVAITIANISGFDSETAGVRTLTITYADKTTDFTVTVKPARVTGVTLNKNTLALMVSETETLAAAVAPQDAGNKNVTWSSSDSDIAAVDSSGKVTAVNVGTAVVTATTADGGFAADCTVTVTLNFVFSISFADFEDLAQEIEGPTIYTFNRPGRPSSASLEVVGELNESVAWYYRGTAVTGAVTFNGVTITPSDTGLVLNCAAGSGLGQYMLTVEVEVGGKRYSKLVTFTVRP